MGEIQVMNVKTFRPGACHNCYFRTQGNNTPPPLQKKVFFFFLKEICEKSIDVNLKLQKFVQHQQITGHINIVDVTIFFS